MSMPGGLPDAAERYLRRLSVALRSIDGRERDAIVQETRSHLMERAGQGSDAVGRALAAFGKPEVYAEGFLEGADLRSALARDSALPMLGEVLKLAGKSAAAFVPATVILLLCTCAFAFGAMAVIKPIAPEAVGLWVDSEAGTFAFGVVSEASRQGATELLGYWIIPVAVVCSVLSLVAARRVVRLVLARRLRSIESEEPAGEG